MILISHFLFFREEISFETRHENGSKIIVNNVWITCFIYSQGTVMRRFLKFKM